MKRAQVSKWNVFAVAAVLGAGALGGCQDNEKQAKKAAEEQSFLDSARALDAGLVSAVRDSAVKNAIIVEHTLYPYHFEPGGGELNELGQRDVAVLAEHFQARPGTMSVRRGAVAAGLYDSRVDAVRRELARDGVAGDAVVIADEKAGGPGMRSERVRIVLERERTAESYYDSKSSNQATLNITENRTGGSNSGSGDSSK